MGRPVYYFTTSSTILLTLGPTTSIPLELNLGPGFSCGHNV